MDVRVRQIYEQNSVRRYINTRSGAQQALCFTSMDAIFKYTVRSKLKRQRKTIKFGSNTSLEPSLAPHSLSLKKILVTLSL